MSFEFEASPNLVHPGTLKLQSIAELSRANLRTNPDFEYEWIDGNILFVKKPEAVSLVTSTTTSITTTTPAPESNNPIFTEVEPPAPVAVAVIGGSVEDPTYRVGKLDAANKPPKYVNPDATLQEAVTVMLSEDFSQLPVMTNEREVKGVISWRSIACRLALGTKHDYVRECMERNVEIVDTDASLFRVIELITQQGFVLIRGKDNKICGIVTEADLGNSFYQLGRPFLLLSEIENHIRGIIDGKFTIEELEVARNPNDTERKISNVADLTFGEYVRLLQNADMWNKVGLKIHRSTFVKTLETVNIIRNDVMHFDPDGISDDDLEELQKTAKFVQELREIAGK